MDTYRKGERPKTLPIKLNTGVPGSYCSVQEPQRHRGWFAVEKLTWEFPKTRGTLQGTYKDCRYLGSTLASPYLGKLPHQVTIISEQRQLYTCLPTFSLTTAHAQGEVCVGLTVREVLIFNVQGLGFTTFQTPPRQIILEPSPETLHHYSM